MSITVTDDQIIETHTYVRHIDIENAAPILLERRYSHGGKEFLPDCATAKWVHGEPIKSITLGGYVLKKDRTTGQQRATLSYITSAHPSWGRGHYPEAPQWLLDDLFADSPNTTPEGA
jgi:hypothetical protein